MKIPIGLPLGNPPGILFELWILSEMKNSTPGVLLEIPQRIPLGIWMVISLGFFPGIWLGISSGIPLGIPPTIPLGIPPGTTSGILPVIPLEISLVVHLGIPSWIPLWNQSKELLPD